MLRWLIGGGREPQGLAEKSVQTLGEEQAQNPYTELLVLKGHHDIVRFLVPVDDYRFASAGDDGIVCLWNAQTGEKLFELHAHTQKITALAAFPVSDACEEKCHMILTADISAMIELPKNCVAAAVGKELIILRLKASKDGTEWDVFEVKRLLDHQDNILSLISISDLAFATGSHVGELIVWDALDWTMQAYECNWDASLHVDPQQEIKLSYSQNKISIQHLASDEECVFAAVGKGIYVYHLQMKRVIAFQRTAHDSTVLHITKVPNRQLISCSEDGSVRIWELREKQQLTAEPVPSGFFNIWGFGRATKQANNTAKRAPESTTIYSLDLTGDLIGHSSAVQMFLYFGEHGLATCSADHLIILWKDGEQESRIRSLMLFHKLEQSEDLQFGP
uniref:WD repeat-containing protein 41 n=1 Tax=Sphaerodactylus townsendi TaxID=933632 RepID=A0ACB8EQ05_9SAUR